MDGIDRTAHVADHISTVYSDFSPPGAWPDQETKPLTRKRKASFEEPALKRHSPSRSIFSISLLRDISNLSPVRFIQRALKFGVASELAPTSSKVDDDYSAREDSLPPIPVRSDNREQDECADRKTSVGERTRLPKHNAAFKLAPSRNTVEHNILSKSLTRSRAARSIFGSMDTESVNGFQKPAAHNLSTSFLEQKKARQSVLTRAALLTVKQPRHGQVERQDLFPTEASQSDDTKLTTQLANGRIKQEHQPIVRRGQRKPMLSQRFSMIPIQRYTEHSRSDPPSPSLQLCDELGASVAISDRHDAIDPTIYNGTWTVPQRRSAMTDYRKRTNAISDLKQIEPDDSTIPPRPLRRHSPPIMSRRFRPTWISATVEDLDARSKSSSHQPASGESLQKVVKEETMLNGTTSGALSVNESVDNFENATTRDTHTDASLLQTPNNRDLIATAPERHISSSTAKFSADQLIDVGRLTIRDESPPVIDTPKASSHSGEKLRRLTRAQLRKKQLEEEALNQYEIVPLSAEWDAKVREAVRRGHGSYASSDLARAVPEYGVRGQDNWLNDEVINGYLNLVTAHGKKNDRPNQTPSYHAFNSFFYSNLSTKGAESVMKWSKRPKINGTNLLNVEAVFIPINTGVHWTLAVVEPKRKTITHYNSMRSTSLGVAACTHIQNWVKRELGKDFVEDEWILVTAGESPQQMNSDDCGVFTVTSARQIMLGFKPISYRSDQMRVQRKRIVAELVNNGLLKSKENAG